MRVRLPALAIALLVLAPGALQAAPVADTAAPADTACRFLVPDDLGAGSTVWLGACLHGEADGAGVLRTRAGDGSVRLFAGVMQQGRPFRGLIDLGRQSTSDYGPIWAFDGTRSVLPTSADQVAMGFRTAAEGAAAASAVYAKQGNAASARFYADWSAALTRAPTEQE